jgi:hypothetical protein
MPKRTWFIHNSGETTGPIPTDVVRQMLKTRGIQFSDYVWTDGFTKWLRMSELDEFAVLMPPYPTASIPTSVPTSVPALPKQKIAEKEKAVEKTKRFTRVHFDGTISTRHNGTFVALNLSESGIFLESEECPPLGSNLSFTIESKFFSKPLEMTGILIRQGFTFEGQRGFAIQFTRVNPACKRIISEFISSRAADDSNE